MTQLGDSNSDMRPAEPTAQAPLSPEDRPPRGKGWRDRYEGSALQELIRGLGAADFGNRIVLFGAALLLSVLPMIVLLSAFAGTRADDDIVRHLGLNQEGARIVEGLFRPAHQVTFNLGILFALVLSFAGTLAVAASVQTIYESVFGHSHVRSPTNLLRYFVWVACTAGLLIGDAAISDPLGHGPVGSLQIGLVDFTAMTLYFWWTMHFLLAERERWPPLLPAALMTALFWIGLGVFASVYFASSTVSDAHLYGTIGVVFTLVTWFIAVGAVLILGAVVGAVCQKRRSRRRGHRLPTSDVGQSRLAGQPGPPASSAGRIRCAVTLQGRSQPGIQRIRAETANSHAARATRPAAGGLSPLQRLRQHVDGNHGYAGA